MTKKKIFIHSDLSVAKTGFGRTMRALITYLYQTNKYDIVHYCCGINYSNIILKKTPWKSIGCLPDTQQEMDSIGKDPVSQRDAGYGGFLIDKVISQEKPDIYIGSQDIWAFNDYQKKWWWNKIPCAIWTTLDSLPILPSAIEAAPAIKNYWIWSSFATKALNKMGYDHVKTVHGPVDDKFFFKLPDVKRKELRERFNIDKDTFIIGFVFRNQLRKTVPALLEGFKIFKQENPITKTKLLLHTSFSEGWNILKLAKEYNIKEEDILTTYICKTCNGYDIKSFTGEEQKCRFCNVDKSISTTNVSKGVTEKQLNEVYNLMDVYVHPMTSGGQEIPCIEAKLCELITCITNYSCGEELCSTGSGSYPLDWAEYREHGTEFIKASTYPSSIAKQIQKIFDMSPQKRTEIGQISRKWALENYSISKIGKFFEDFIDSSEKTNFDFSNNVELKNPHLQIPKEIEEDPDDLKYILYLYKNILKMDVDQNDQGVKHWMGVLNSN